MNESQQITALTGISAGQVQEFVRQYIALSVAGNTIGLWVSCIIFCLALFGFIKTFTSRNRYGRNNDLRTTCFLVGIIALIVFQIYGWDRYKMAHYPLPYVLQDLRSK